MDHIRREKGYFTAESGKIFLSQKIIEHRNQQKHPISLESVFSRLKTGNRTRFIELLFYIYFEIWADYTQGLLYIIFILSFFNNVQ